MDTPNRVLLGKIESLLYVAGDPVPVTELSRVLGMSEAEMRTVLAYMESTYKAEDRGIIPVLTEQSVQFTTNQNYSGLVETLLQPEQTKSVSKSLLETLAVVAYKQPVTRAEVEAVRGVRCDYAVTQLIKLGLVEQCGRKEVLGHPALFQTTDLFLRKFGLHARSELPGYLQFCGAPSEECEEISLKTV